MIDLRFQHLPEWPGASTKKRSKGAFSVSYNKMLDLLEFELRYLQATDIVVQARFARNDLRNDGWPRAGVKPGHPGIVLSFKSKHGPLSLRTDHFFEWTDNLRAIGLHLEMLRRASQYGVGESGEQYKGWLALEAPLTTIHNLLDAARVLAPASGIAPSDICASYENARDAYRKAAMMEHPDRGGDGHRFQLVQDAWKLLEAHLAPQKKGEVKG